MTAPLLSLTRRHARMASYSVWQFKDFAVNIAVVSILLFGLFGAMEIAQIHLQEQMLATRRPGMTMDVRQKLMAFMTAYNMFAMVGPLICLTGVASQDRTQGYTRFLFAKPVSVRAYYAQALLVRFAGFLLLGHVLVIAYGMYEPPAYTPRFIADMTVAFLSVGGIVFLLSVLTRYDGLIAIVFLLVTALIRGRWVTETGIKHAVTYLFPPIDQLGDVHNWVVKINPGFGPFTDVFPWKWGLWSAGYGLACLLLGLYLLRRIPLTKA